MDVLGDMVSPDRGDDELWIHRPGPRSRSWSGEQFCVDAWKAGNLLRHYGVREGATVGVLGGSNDTGMGVSPQALIGLFGAWVLGASVRVDPPVSPDVRVLVGPTGRLDDYELPPGSTAMGFGEQPDDATVAHFEGERWSENPVKFPVEADPGDAALLTGSRTLTHEDVLDASRVVATEYGIEAGERVALSAPLSDPGTVIAGVVAPLLGDATATLGDDGALIVAEQDGANVIRPSAVWP